MTHGRSHVGPLALVPCVGGRLRADASAPAEIRRVLTAFLARHGVGEELTADVLLVTTEAVTNVVLHAYGEAGGDVEYAADADGGDVQVVIADTGLGIRPDHRSVGAGLGLKIIASQCDAFEIEERLHGGLEVWMRFVAEPH
jgi:anti-sigma regulatory factor (Ser/Thr protein kinase)